MKETNNHKAYRTALHETSLPVFATGSAGTGKTYNAVSVAYQKYSNKDVSKIVVLRPAVSYAEAGGFLPGTEREKLDPWTRPIMHSLQELGVCKNEIECMENSGNLVFQSLEFVQGLTWENSYIIIDECQNLTFDQIKMLLTRQGKYSKLVLCGDVAQVSPKFKLSGLRKFLDMVEVMNANVHWINFTREDIVRSEQCKYWIETFEDYEHEFNVS